MAARNQTAGSEPQKKTVRRRIDSKAQVLTMDSFFLEVEAKEKEMAAKKRKPTTKRKGKQTKGTKKKKVVEEEVVQEEVVSEVPETTSEEEEEILNIGRPLHSSTSDEESFNDDEDSDINMVNFNKRQYKRMESVLQVGYYIVYYGKELYYVGTIMKVSNYIAS